MQHELVQSLSKALISNDEDKKGIKLILQIISNILKYPTTHKYRNINLRLILKKFNNNKSWINVLHVVGFTISHENKSRLVLNANNINKLQTIYQQIIHITTDLLLPRFAKETKITIDHDDNDTKQELKCNCFDSKGLGLDDAVEYLSNMGFTEKEKCMNAFIKAEYDIHQAVEYLINATSKTKADTPSASNNGKCSTNELIQMGFSNEKVSHLMKKYNNDLNHIVDVLLQISVTNDCQGSIEKCGSYLRIVKQLKQYSDASIDNEIDFTRVLNDFNHLLHEHDDSETTQNIFEQCNVLQCERFQRHYRNRRLFARRNNEEKIYKYEEVPPVECQMFDRIHCHFFHRKLSKIDEIHKDCGNIMQSHKFSQLKYDSAHNSTEYSFGQRFYYWDYHKY
eukprot:264015_1